MKKKVRNPSIKRLFLRGYAARLANSEVMPLVRRIVYQRAKEDLSGILAITNCAQKKTIETSHVLNYYASHGRRLYGSPENKRRKIAHAPDPVEA